MHKAKRWRYYCDFCGKATGSAASIQAHEPICFLNEKRKCKWCHDCQLDRLKECLDVYYPIKDHEIAFAALDAMLSITTCRACIYAAIKQKNNEKSIWTWFYHIDGKRKKFIWIDDISELAYLSSYIDGDILNSHANIKPKVVEVDYDNPPF